jgi:replicative DNA helicase
LALSIHPEQGLISAVLRTGDYQVLASRGITSDMFHAYPDEARWLERYITRNGKAPGKASFRQKWPEFRVKAVDDAGHWCDEVRREHIRQSMVDLMDQSLDLIDKDDLDTAVKKLHAGLVHVQATQEGMSAEYDVFDDWAQTYDTISARVDRVRTRGWAGVPSGFPTLDAITGGWQDGWFGVVAARLGQGKTWSGVRMGWAAACTQHVVDYYSLEQSRHQIAMRVYAFASKQYGREVFNSLDLSRGKGFDIKNLREFLQELRANVGNGKFNINDTSRGIITPLTIAAGIEQRQPNICFIDYLTLMQASGDDWRATARLSADLQSVAQRYNVPIVAMSQVNRLGISKEPPGAEHLSQADAIGQDADVVLTMMQRSKHVMKMKLAKFRHGPGGVTWFCRFSPGTGQYDEISGDEAEEQIERDHEED